MQFRLICILVFMMPAVCNAQLDDKDFKTNFAFSVHSMDDFFDRFNFKTNTIFEKYVRRQFPEAVFTREGLLYNLFNKKNQFFYQNNNAKEFVQQVTDTAKQQFINYSDKFWYAEIKCKVTYMAKPYTIIMVLKVEQPEPDMFLWAVVSAKGEFLKSTTVAAHPATSKVSVSKGNTNSATTKYFLSPVSHGIDFTNLENFFINRSHAHDYLYNGVVSPELKQLIFLIENNRIKFHQVSSIKYHLLQVNGWIISVSYFNRSTLNSGWLINNLMKVTSDEKRLFLRKQLNVVL